MPLTDPAYLEHIRAACLEVARDLRDAGIDDLSAPSAWRNSVLYSLIVIGEAVNRLSPGLTARYPDIPWRKVVDLRNVLTHRYFAIDPHLVRQTAETHVPRLLRQVEVMLMELAAPG